MGLVKQVCNQIHMLIELFIAYADWVQYYADLGVEGIHMYAVVADFILSPNGGGYMHVPGNYKALSIENHRLLRWKIFHPSPWSLHYYGQWLIYNDCAFRWRHYYEYLLFVDRDEFLHFVGKKPHEVASACPNSSVPHP